MVPKLRMTTIFTGQQVHIYLIKLASMIMIIIMFRINVDLLAIIYTHDPHTVYTQYMYI